MTPLPDQVKPNGKRARVVLDLHTGKPNSHPVVDPEQRAKEFKLLCQARPNRLPSLIPAIDAMGIDLRLKETALKETAWLVSQTNALATANILPAHLIDPALLRQVSQLGQTLSTVPLMIPAVRRQMSQFDQTIAGLSSLLSNQVADTLKIVENLTLWIQELSQSIQISFPPPNPLVSDLIAALDRDPSAAERLALRIDWNPNHWQRESIKLKARVDGLSPKQVAKNALIQGVILALGWEKGDELPVLIGPESAWLYGDQQQLTTVSPMQMPLRFFWDWIKEEAIRAAWQWLVGFPYAPSVVLQTYPDDDSDWQLFRFT